MRRRWTRPALVTVLAAIVGLGAGVGLGPLRERDIDPPPPTSTASASASADALRKHVARSTAHLTEVPGDWHGWAQLGMSHLELARSTGDPAHYSNAETALRRSLTVRPTGNAAALTGMGALANARHDFTDALRFARRAVTVDRYSADAYGVLTDALVELGRYGQANTAVRHMLALRPDTASYARASYLLELHGDNRRAAQFMNRALDLAGSPAEATFALLQLGQLAFHAGDLDTAAARFADGLSRQARHPDLLAWRGRVAAAQGNLPAAATDLRAATAIRPSVEHAVALSEVLTAAGDHAGATRAIDLARVSASLQVGPGADVDQVLFEAEHGDPLAAVTAGRSLYAARPSVIVEMAYAWALHAAGRDAQALPHAEHALRLGTRDARLHYQRGIIRLAVGDRAGARRDLTDAVRINAHFSLRHAPAARALLTTLDGAP